MDENLVILFMAFVILTMGFAYMYKNKPGTTSYDAIIRDLKNKMAVLNGGIKVEDMSLSNINFKAISLGDQDPSSLGTKQYNLAVTGCCNDGALHVNFVSNNSNKANNPNGVIMSLYNSVGGYDGNRIATFVMGNTQSQSRIDCRQWGNADSTGKAGSSIEFSTTEGVKAIVLPKGGLWLRKSVDPQFATNRAGMLVPFDGTTLDHGSVLYVNSDGNLMFKKPGVNAVKINPN